MLDALLSGMTETRSLRRWVVPLLRAYIRYAPVSAGKRAFWTRVVNPYFAWRSHAFVASTIFGRRIAGNTRDMIQQYIYYFGVWEPNLTRWIRQRLRPGDTFVDVGANIGYYSLLASALVGPAGRVVAVEASAKNFAALRDNLRRNRATNVRARHLAASDREGPLRLFRGADYNDGESTLFPGPGSEVECEVRAAPLSAILRPEEVRGTRLIKIDVEGAEWPVVLGMAPLLPACREDLEVILEVHPGQLAQQGKRAEDILAVFAAAGLHAYKLTNDYWALSYLPPYEDQRPRRLRGPVERETQLVFSRRDVEVL
jgi:FkbM family methyltransferase